MRGSEEDLFDEEDFGDVDEEEMLKVFTQAQVFGTHTPTWEASEGRAPKRQRVEEPARCLNGFAKHSPLAPRFGGSMAPLAVDTVTAPNEVNLQVIRDRGIQGSSNHNVPRGNFGRSGTTQVANDLSIREVGAQIPRSRASNGRSSNTPTITAWAGTVNARANDAETNDIIEEELANLPSDAFSSSPITRVNRPEVIEISSQQEYGGQWQPQRGGQSIRGPQRNLKQTTLFGEQAEATGSQAQSQSNRRHNFVQANKEEPPTHHALNERELQTWTYPTNLGSIRDYQFNIVANGLFNNLLVALPTGLGKTFIAATIMLNWYRWTKNSQIVFVAPTKPLVSQQVDACFKIAGIPRSETTMLTGDTAPGIRAEEWNEKRVFFMTPHTIVNDLKTGICDPKKIVLVVIDEAHRATGNYSYVELVTFLRRFNTSFRVLALTATPGNSVETVQQVIDGLGISLVEIRTEESIDIRQYVQYRSIETTLFDYNDQMKEVMDLLSKALQSTVTKLNAQNAHWCKDPMKLTAYGLTQSRVKWMQSPAGRNANPGVKGMINAAFTVLASVAHAIDLLKFHGIGPCYQKLKAFRAETESIKKPGVTRSQIVDHKCFQDVMAKIESWVRTGTFVGHPKLEFLQEITYNHFLDAGEGRGVGADQISPAETRIMIFAHFRDSAEEIVRVLKRMEGSIVRPHVFVGQATSNDSEGMGQKKQQEIIQQFKSGVYNTLVATSIGEEGLDIGEVDLIICYDASASPIRMLQRMGRTGRKRAGKIEVLLMKDKEADNFAKAKDNYEKMQAMICDGKRFTFHHDISPRILPWTTQPVVDKKVVNIPPENSQGDPQPSKRRKAPKRPPKKFHMPDGVRQGFAAASRLNGGNTTDEGPSEPERAISPPCEPPVPLEEVLLTRPQQAELDRNYLNINSVDTQVVEPPSVSAFPALQRTLRPAKHVKHGWMTKSYSRMMSNIHERTVHGYDYGKHLSAYDKQEIDTYMEQRKAGQRDGSEPELDIEPEDMEVEESEDIDHRGELLDLDAQHSSNTNDPVNDDYDFDDLDDDDSLRDFIDDETPARGLSGNRRLTSSVTSPPSAGAQRSRKDTLNDVVPVEDEVNLSEEDLSVLDRMFAKESGKSSSPAPVQGRRRKNLNVVDSDEE